MGKMFSDQQLAAKRVSCAPGQVKVKRKRYTRKDGTKVSATEYCAEDQGSPGVVSRGAKQGPFSGEEPWITREGKLGGPGYTERSQKERRKILRRCVEEYGYRSCLGSVMVLLRSSELSASVRKKLEADKTWLMKEYGGPGSFEENPCCDSCAVGGSCESSCSVHQHGHGPGCTCPRCDAAHGYMNNPTSIEFRKLKSKLLR